MCEAKHEYYICTTSEIFSVRNTISYIVFELRLPGLFIEPVVIIALRNVHHH